MWQCVAVCCSVLQYVAVYCSVLQCVAVCCCSVLLQCKVYEACFSVCGNVLQCVAVCCSVLLQCVVAVYCCSVLPCVAVHVSVRYIRHAFQEVTGSGSRDTATRWNALQHAATHCERNMRHRFQELTDNEKRYKAFISMGDMTRYIYIHFTDSIQTYA